MLQTRPMYTFIAKLNTHIYEEQKNTATRYYNNNEQYRWFECLSKREEGNSTHLLFFLDMKSDYESSGKKITCDSNFVANLHNSLPPARWVVQHLVILLAKGWLQL